MEHKKPDGMTSERDKAWDLLYRGETQVETGKAVGRSTTTINKWVREWRTDIDEALFKEPAKNLEPTWSEQREIEAKNLMVTGSQVRARLLALLPSVGTQRVDRGADGTADPVVVQGPNAKVILDLATAIVKLNEGGEQMVSGRVPGSGNRGRRVS